jgi:hypothetical protein
MKFNALFGLLVLFFISCKKESINSSNGNLNDNIVNENLINTGSTTVEISGLNSVGNEITDAYSLEYSSEENIYYSASETASSTINFNSASPTIKFEIRQRQKAPSLNSLNFDILYSAYNNMGIFTKTNLQYIKDVNNSIVIDSETSSIESKIVNIIFDRINSKLIADYEIERLQPKLKIRGKINVFVKEKK